jgi:hypothetical protein
MNNPNNPTPSEHILVQFERGDINDLEHVLLGLINKMAQSGTQHRAELLSRESIRKLVFDWVIGQDDHHNLDEQAVARRMVDGKFSPGSTYASWIATQPKSSPNKRLYEDRTRKL